MPFQNTANPDQLSILTRALDEHCQTVGVPPDSPKRENLASRVFALFSTGKTTLEAEAGAIERRILEAFGSTAFASKRGLGCPIQRPNEGDKLAGAPGLKIMSVSMPGTKNPPFGFAKPRQTQHWYCIEHREHGDRHLQGGEMISPPRQQGDYLDRDLDCQEAMEPGFKAIVDCDGLEMRW